jgi:hypothetical protein
MKHTIIQCVPYTDILADTQLIVTIPYSENFSVVVTIILMVPKGFISLSKVRYALPQSLLMSYPHRLVSHHPPISAFYYISPANKLAILGELRPKSKFLGNSVSTVMEGENRILLMGQPEDGGEYIWSDTFYSISMMTRIRHFNA